MKQPSKWHPYLDKAKDLLEEDPSLIGHWSVIAGKLLDIPDGEKDKDKDLLRMYLKRKLSQKHKKNKRKSDSNKNKGNAVTWEESTKGAFWQYDGYTSIRSLEQALKYCDADLDLWEVERYIFNSWDTTMKDINGAPTTATNYQVKVWFTPKISVKVKTPEYRHIDIPVGKAQQMWVAIGCVHRPFHDKVVWDKFLQFLKNERENITGVIVDGDFLDLRSLSSHEEWIPEGIDLSVEYSDGAQGIQEIEDSLNEDIDKIYIYGNHEDRFFRDKKAIRMYGSSLQAPHEAMGLPEKGWEVITDWKNGYVTLGKNTDVFHGNKVGMNAAKDQLAALPTRDHIFFHTHRFGVYSNKTNTSYNLGCMIDFDSPMFKYVDRGVRAAWSHGFGVIYVDPKNNTHVYPIKVDEDKGFFFKGIAY